MLIISLNRAQGNVFSLCVSTAPTSSVLWLWIITIRTLSTPSPFFSSSLSPHILFSTPWCVCMCINTPENHHHLCCLFPCVCCICMLLNLHVGLPEALRYSLAMLLQLRRHLLTEAPHCIDPTVYSTDDEGNYEQGWQNTNEPHGVFVDQEKSENTWLELSNYWRWFQVFQG